MASRRTPRPIDQRSPARLGQRRQRRRRDRSPARRAASARRSPSRRAGRLRRRARGGASAASSARGGPASTPSPVQSIDERDAAHQRGGSTSPSPVEPAIPGGRRARRTPYRRSMSAQRDGERRGVEAARRTAATASRRDVVGDAATPRAADNLVERRQRRVVTSGAAHRRRLGGGDAEPFVPRELGDDGGAGVERAQRLAATVAGKRDVGRRPDDERAAPARIAGVGTAGDHDLACPAPGPRPPRPADRAPSARSQRRDGGTRRDAPGAPGRLAAAGRKQAGIDRRRDHGDGRRAGPLAGSPAGPTRRTPIQARPASRAQREPPGASRRAPRRSRCRDTRRRPCRPRRPGTAPGPGGRRRASPPRRSRSRTRRPRAPGAHAPARGRARRRRRRARDPGAARPRPAARAPRARRGRPTRSSPPAPHPARTAELSAPMKVDSSRQKVNLSKTFSSRASEVCWRARTAGLRV